MRIFVIGSFVRACCWNVQDIPLPGQTLTATGLHIEAGGKGLNVAIGTKRLGAEVDVLFGIGDDDAGDDLIKLLNTEDISASYTHRLATQSGYGAGMIAASGQNAIAVFPGPNLLLSADHANAASAAIQTADLVYAQFEAAMPAIEKTFEIAKQAGVKTVLNPSPWHEMSAGLLANTDVILVNEVEVLDLLNVKHANLVESLEAWSEWLKLHSEQFFKVWAGELLVVTLGKLGAIALKANGEVILATAPLVKTVDTIGCGDAFASGFCSQYLQQDLKQTLAYANACGAILASHAGILSALPRAATVDSVLGLIQ